MTAKYVTIGIKATTKAKLLKLFKPRETWDELLDRIVDEAIKYEQINGAEKVVALEQKREWGES